MSTIENWNSDNLIRNKNELDQNPSSCNDMSGLIKKNKNNHKSKACHLPVDNYV